jgi:hypothetical protein
MKVTIDYDLKTISYGSTTLTTANSDVLHFFQEAQGTNWTNITIGSTSTTDAFSIQDLQLFTSPTPVDPIVLDLGNEGIDLSYATAFDLHADGQLDNVAWTDGQDGLLVMDLDKSGAIENGTEVFSPDFGQGGYANALEALAGYWHLSLGPARSQGNTNTAILAGLLTRQDAPSRIAATGAERFGLLGELALLFPW